MLKFSESVAKLGQDLFELLSEALDLNSNHLTNMGCVMDISLSVTTIRLVLSLT